MLTKIGSGAPAASSTQKSPTWVSCLELDVDVVIDVRDDDPMPNHVVTLLRAAPALALDELAIIRCVDSGSDGWCTTLLTDLFDTLGPPASAADSIYGWDLDVAASGDSCRTWSSVIHIVERQERQGDGNAVKTVHRPWTDDWTAQSILSS
ncbi:hypothetical protein C8R47DRAFT_1205005 [Mycena vitilis]|nr:hypothetical protein C8R47DRAFT_1205005 [Mycena vitilis]